MEFELKGNNHDQSSDYDDNELKCNSVNNNKSLKNRIENCLFWSDYILIYSWVETMNRDNSSLISSDAIFLFIVYLLCIHQLLIINNFVLCFIIIFLFVLLYNLYSDCKTSPIITNKLDAIQNYFVCDCRKLFRKKQTVAFCCRTKAKKKERRKLCI